MNRVLSVARWASVPAAVLAVVGLGSSSAWADEAVLAPVVVTATRTATYLTDVLADISVIDADAIARSGAGSLADVLVQVPGLEMVRNGGPLASTSLFVRGGNTNHTVVMIDGIRIDTQSGSGGATCQAIAAHQIERIEILRGPAAAIYGSDAVAGVIQIFTKEGQGQFTPSVGLGLGTHGTRTGTVGLRGAQGGLRYSLSVGREISDGYNIQPAANPDKDGYTRNTASARLGWDIATNHQLEATWVYSEADAGYDSTTTKTDINYGKDNRALQKLSALGLSWQAKWSDVWSSRVAMTQADDRYATLSAPGAVPGYETETQIQTLLWQNTWKRKDSVWMAALETRRDELTNASTNPRQTDRAQDALALGYGAKFGAHSWQINARLDDDSEFGRHTTGALAYGYALTPAWRVTGSVGTAFRAPTLYQRFSESGIPDLSPEQSRNREVGVHYRRGGHEFAVVTYKNEISNLITYVRGRGACVSTRGCYANTARATLQGVTLSGATHTKNVAWTASLDLQDPVDAATGKRLARRAQSLLKLGAETQWQSWGMRADVLLSGDRFDNASNTVRLPGYGILNVSATRELTPQWSLVLRMDNVGDKYYETAAGYATPGRTLFAGLTWTGR